MPCRQSGSHANPTQSIEKSLKNTAISSVLPPASKDLEKEPASDLSLDEDCRMLTPTLPISDSSFVEVINEFPSTSMAMKKGSSHFIVPMMYNFSVLFFIIKHSLRHMGRHKRSGMQYQQICECMLRILIRLNNILLL
jgi:hypothetical protein